MLVDWHRHGSRLGPRIFPRNGVHPNNPNPLQHPNKQKKTRNTNFGSAIKKGKTLTPPHTHTHTPAGPLHPQLFIEALPEVIGYVSLHPICLTAKIFCTPIWKRNILCQNHQLFAYTSVPFTYMYLLQTFVFKRKL